MAGGKVPRLLLRPVTALWTLRRCELCDNHLSTESTVQPGQQPGTARTGYSYLGLYPGTQHQPQPHNPTWNSKSSQEKVLYWILFCYLQFLYGGFLLIPVGGPSLQVHHQNQTRKFQTGSGIIWAKDCLGLQSCRNHSQPILFMSLEYLSRKVITRTILIETLIFQYYYHSLILVHLMIV